MTEYQKALLWEKPVQASIGWEISKNQYIWDDIRYFDTMEEADDWTSKLLKEEKDKVKFYDSANYFHRDSLEFIDEEWDIESELMLDWENGK